MIGRPPRPTHSRLDTAPFPCTRQDVDAASLSLNSVFMTPSTILSVRTSETLITVVRLGRDCAAW
jgi:hypothetical protein